MQIVELEENILKDSAVELIIQSSSRDLQILCYILESFEGYCNYSTIDKQKSIIRIVCPKDFAPEVKKIISYLRNFSY
ncbi:MAG: DUF4911 domain-containing protein [Candidatus Cloacimonadia bacterium]